MSRIARVTQKQYGSNGPTGNFGQFGSLAANANVTSKDPAVIQALQAWLNGLFSAVVQVGNEPAVPAIEDINSLFFVAFYQLAYLLQSGIPEWDGGTTYFKNNYCQVSGTLYLSLTDNNVNNNPTTDVVNWQAGPNSNINGSLYGGVSSNNAVDPTFRIDFTACQSKDDTNLYVMSAPGMTKNVTSLWAPGTGQGGMDQGTIGSTPVLMSFYQIGDKFGVNPSDFIFSKSATSPLLPTGYNIKRFIGSRRWNGVSWDQFITIGNEASRDIYFLSPIQLVYRGTSTVFAPVSVLSYINPTYSKIVDIMGQVQNIGSNISGGVLYIKMTGSVDAPGDANMFHYAVDNQNGPGNPSGASVGLVPTGASGSFQYATTASEGATIYLRGYREDL